LWNITKKFLHHLLKFCNVHNMISFKQQL
jgi:hypothetical protein